jgi:hypothetical protein
MGWRGRDCQEGKGRGDASLGLSPTHPSPGDCSHCMGMPDQGLCRSSSPWKARPGQLPRRGGRADNSSAMGIEGRSQPLQGKGQTWVVRLRDSALWHQGEADQDTICRNRAAVRPIFSNQIHIRMIAVDLVQGICCIQSMQCSSSSTRSWGVYLLYSKSAIQSFC